jgi:phosphatidate phosphatase LPIN
MVLLISYHSWTTAAPCILSHIAFGRPINESGLNMVIDQSSPQVPVSGGYSFIRGWWGGRSSSNTPTNHINRSTSPQRNLNSSLLKSPQVIPIRGMSPVIGSKDLQSHTASPNLGNSSIQFAKSLRMTSDQLKSLNLKKGVNHITFTVTSALQGSQTCSAKIFFWDYNTKIVISDVDGTITK